MYMPILKLAGKIHSTVHFLFEMSKQYDERYLIVVVNINLIWCTNYNFSLLLYLIFWDKESNERCLSSKIGVRS